MNPRISAPPRDADLSLGASTLLECQVSGFPHPHTIWRKTNPLSRTTEELSVVGPTHLQLSTGLQLRNVSGNDTGVYECVIENAFGSAMQQATVRVEGQWLMCLLFRSQEMDSGSEYMLG